MEEVIEEMCLLEVLGEEPVAGRVSEWDLLSVGEVEKPGIGGAVSRAWTALYMMKAFQSESGDIMTRCQIVRCSRC